MGWRDMMIAQQQQQSQYNMQQLLGGLGGSNPFLGGSTGLLSDGLRSGLARECEKNLIVIPTFLDKLRAEIDEWIKI